MVQLNDDRKVTVDAGQDGFSRTEAPSLASIERAFASLELLQAGVRAHQVIGVLVVERRPESHHVDPVASKHRDGLASDEAIKLGGGPGLQLVTADLDESL